MKKLLHNTGIFTLLALLATPVPARAESDAAHPRTITVSGESNQEVAPDQAILSVSLVSKNAELAAAKEHNDALAGKLVAVARQLNIPQEKIATSGVSIAPEYAYDRQDGHPRFTGYNVSRSLRITMDSTNVHEKLLSAVVDAGIDQINGLEFSLANPEAYAGPLRVKAFVNAKAKAEALAQAAGSKLGPALAISSGEVAPVVPPRPIPMMAQVMHGPMSVAPSLPGMIDLQESVTVTFALE